jgi:cytochrome c2
VAGNSAILSGYLLEGAMTARAVLFAFASALLVFSMVGCNDGQLTRGYTVSSIGNPRHGKELIEGYGCGGCHLIPGVHAARGMVGPPLLSFSQRTMIAGELPNTPANLARWIENPKAVEPHTAMPDLGLTEDQAYDVAAYLYTLRGTEGYPWNE